MPGCRCPARHESQTMRNAIAISVLCALACGCADRAEKPAEDCVKEKPVNPNGDSELALLMREMFDEAALLKQRVIDGEKPDGLKRFEDIHRAVPTDKEVKGPVFDAFAASYIGSIRQLEAEDSSTVFRFNRMVDQCMNCHTEFCPGPKKRIGQLYIKD